MNRIFIVLLLLIGQMFEATAQEMWINSMPFHFNPSFAGSTGKPRFTASSTLRIDENSTHITSYYKVNQNYLSYDDFIAKLSTGIGIELNYSHVYNYSSRGMRVDGTHLEQRFVVAPKISWAGRYTLSPSIMYNHHSESYKKSYYDEPQYYPEDTLFLYPDTATFSGINKPKDYNDLQLSLLFNSPRFFAGGGTTVLKYKGSNGFPFDWDYNITIGCRIGKPGVTRFTFTPVFFYRNYIRPQLAYTYVFLHDPTPRPSSKENPFMSSIFNISTTLTYKNAMAGIDVFSNLMLGYTFGDFQIMLAGNLGRVGYGRTFQLSVRYTKGNNKNKM